MEIERLYGRDPRHELAAFDLNLLLAFRAMMAERHRFEAPGVSLSLGAIPRLGENEDSGFARCEPGAVAAVREGLGEHFRLTPTCCRNGRVSSTVKKVPCLTSAVASIGGAQLYER
jgi:hypothetical protein